MEEAGLGHLAPRLADSDRWGQRLSGGEQQRVAIARALAGSPSVILADEPTGALDSTTSVEIMLTLQQLNREQGLTIIIVTHEADIAAYADRIVTIRDGVVLHDRKNEAHHGIE